ncbi:MAG: ASKHA domain-containing protein [Caldilineaceae bacterium]
MGRSMWWRGRRRPRNDIVLTEWTSTTCCGPRRPSAQATPCFARAWAWTRQDVGQVLIGGAFGQYINIEKAIQIGLLPDLPWERFQFLGNTSVKESMHGPVEP